ncbi:MAG: FAD-binding oxidoreductase [Roseitalea sp.]|jgi:FAD/FMN-containing dehydrogenase|nr:FAD-binding oxidoreductase [Roseitalea sp.]MBO6722027.1 FAD-binding oxidoreductase [Roseitalea sp.]MBO6743465.1 FAD-binding oxidoreductase [Roseitalea sp.]
MKDDLRSRFIAIVGNAHAATADDEIAPHLREWRARWTGAAAAVLKPGTTAEVAAILKLASETGTPIVPQGGNTGLVGGQIPDASGDAIIVSTTRLNRIRAIDPDGDTMTVEAGVVLQTIQETADANDRLFPLSLAAQGSAQIGGNLSTNAGGTGALAYGVARDLCLGLEVALPTGEVLDDLNRLKKNNTGYDLRDLFIGAEGTLGIITAAVLKLHPKPRGRAAAFLAVPSPQAALSFFRQARTRCGPSLTTFELMARMGIDFTVRHMHGARDPLDQAHPWYVLIELSSGRSEADARAELDHLVETGFGGGTLVDGVVAESEAQRLSLWHLREAMSESQIPEGGSIKHDISVPVTAIPAFLDGAGKAVAAIVPDARPCPFGHMGDGNLHYNISQPVGWEKADFLALTDRITPAVHAIVRAHDGSISAEHGIGQMKRDELAEVKSPVALDLMRRIKTAFDPAGIMNRGKVL